MRLLLVWNKVIELFLNVKIIWSKGSGIPWVHTHIIYGLSHIALQHLPHSLLILWLVNRLKLTS